MNTYTSMFFDNLNPIIFAVTLFSGYFLWLIIKMTSRPTTSNNGTKIENMLLEWWTTRKITKWKNQNKMTDNYSDDRIHNKHFKFFGCSQTDEALFVEFRNNNDKQDASFILTLKDGSYLTIPIELEQHLASTSCGKDMVSSKGLTVERLIPYSKWRITYNGLSYINKPGNQTENTEAEPRHVIFTFFWATASEPLSSFKSWSPSLLARALRNVEQSEGYLNELLSSDEGFAQFGSLFGQVIIDNGDSKDTFEMNLPGVRMSRNLKENTAQILPNTWSLVATCKDGLVVSLSARNIENQNRIISGCVRMPSMDAYPIEDINLNVSDFEVSTISKEIGFNIKAHKTLKSTIHVTSNASQTSQLSGYLIEKTSFNIDINGQSGRGYIISSKKMPKSKLNIESNASIKTTRNNPKPRNVWKAGTLTLFFNEPDAQSEQLCGGKGSSLAFLTQLAIDESENKSAFVVPQGFTLTTDAFDIQLKQNPRLSEAISNIEQIAYNRVNGKLDKACEEVTKLFIETPIEIEVANAVKKAYSILVNNSGSSVKVAVRSSAIGEDSAESSSAGQNETFLGVQAIDQVLVAIQKCWASLFTVQSVTYRIQNIQPINTKMSVVVQTMVDADCAGVLFTQHPVTKDPSKLLVTANYGLGESVVSGKVDPDMFIVQRYYRNNNLCILERKLGGKDSFIHMSSEADVNSSKVSETLQKQLCLMDETLLELCEIGIQLQESYGSPRDIEWAIHKGKIYLLQSRPMTSIKSFTAWELLHEHDTAVMSDEDYFTFGNVGEVMPEVTTPLSISIVIPSFERGLFQIFPFVKELQFVNQAMTVSHNRVAINIFGVFLRMIKREITIENRVHGLSIFGHEFLTEDVHRIAVHRYGTISKLTEWMLMWHSFKSGWRKNATVEELNQFMEKFIGTYNRRNLRMFKSLKDLYEDVTQKTQDGLSYVQGVHALTSMMCSIYQIIMFSALAEGKNQLNSDLLSDITTLLSSCKNAESAEIPTMLEEIAATLLRCNSVKAQEFCDISPDKGIAWLTENCITAYTLFESFIEKHAHRGFQEFDVGYETWGMHPELVIEMLQQTVRNWKTNEGNIKSIRKRTNEELLDELKTPSKSSTRRTVQFALPRCQAYVEMRERTKSKLVAYIHELRKAYCYLAEKMQAEGLLPDMNLIFYLNHQEIGTLIDDRSRSDLISKAIRRRRLFPEWRKLRFKEFHWGLIKPRNDDQEAIASDSVKVIGTPVCEGKVTGRACVVKTFAEVSKIKSGDILITHSTDIAWSPYFPILSGVVTELGGLISHGAVVAREYGLPCIVGATNATAIIADGEQIYMDASTGVIVKLGKDNEIKI